MTGKAPITVAYGDGIGPEIMAAALFVLREAGASLDINTIHLGEKVYQAGSSSGIEEGAWDVLRATRVLYKAPITTPQGGGFKSVNVTLRKALGLYANVRPCVSYFPYIDTRHPLVDMVIVRENEEDLYGGIEHRQTQEVYQALKLITRPGSERVIRYAFEYARLNGRKKVSCFTKDNILKMTDGLFHRVFDEVAAEYPDIEHEHLIIDIGMARVADSPEFYDVIVVPNLYGDIMSDVAAQIAGSVGLAGSANIGEEFAMFEAIHGSAPDIAGQGVANPSGLLLAGVMMLNHLGQHQAAERIHNAWLLTIEDGIHTRDIYKNGVSRQRVGTMDFARAVVDRLGQAPRRFTPVHYGAGAMPQGLITRPPAAKKELVGVDVFLDWDEKDRDPLALGKKLKKCAVKGLELTLITNRGQRVWPETLTGTYLSDHWRCRFEAKEGRAVTHRDVIALLESLAEAGFDFIKMEHLYTFDGERGFSLGQGQ